MTPWLALRPLLLVALPAIASAQEAEPLPVLSPFPRLSVEGLAEVQTDARFATSPDGSETTDTYVTFGTDVALETAEGTGLFATFTFEPIETGVEDRLPFEDHALYVERLFLRYEADVAAVRAGKFGVRFGAAFDDAPGLYGADFALDYEFAERLGFDLSAPFSAFGGDHEAVLSLFTADTTPLSRSIITDRGRLRRSDGGPANTGTLDSFAASIVGAFGDVVYNAGFIRQARADDGASAPVFVTSHRRGGGDRKAETGGVLGLLLPLLADEEDQVDLLAEGAFFDGYDGLDRQAFIGTVGLSWITGPWTVSAVAATRSISSGGSDDLLLTAGLDYAITDSLTAAAAYRWGDEDGVESHTVGVYLGWAFGYSSSD